MKSRTIYPQVSSYVSLAMILFLFLLLFHVKWYRSIFWHPHNVSHGETATTCRATETPSIHSSVHHGKMRLLGAIVLCSVALLVSIYALSFFLLKSSIPFKTILPLVSLSSDQSHTAAVSPDEDRWGCPIKFPAEDDLNGLLIKLLRFSPASKTLNP